MITPDRQTLESFLASPLGKWTPWDVHGHSPQGMFIRAAAKHKIRIFRSGNRCGKTTCVVADALLHLLGFHPFSRFKGPQRWWFSGLDWDFGIGQVLWPTIQELLPEELVAGITWRRKLPPQLPLSIYFKNGSMAEFKSADGGARKYQGAKLHGAVMDEEHELDVVEETRARLLDYGGYLSLSLTPIRRLRWVQELENNDRLNVFSIRASTMDAARAGIIPLKDVEDFAASLPENQRRVRVYGDYVALEGVVYPQFDKAKHVAKPEGGHLLLADGHRVAPWPIPKSWPRYAAVDFGYDSPTAVVVAAHDTTKGRLIVERVYYASGIRSHVWAGEMRRVLPRLAWPIICDHDSNGRAEFEAAGLPTCAAQKAVAPGLELVSRLWLPSSRDDLPQIVLVEDEHNDPSLGRCDALALRKEIETYHYAKPRNDGPDRPDRPVKKDDHACDALRYLCAGVVGLTKRGSGLGSMGGMARRLRIGW